MKAEEILGNLSSLGVQIRPDGDLLKLKPFSKLTPELHEEVRKHKGELLEMLGKPVADVLGGVKSGATVLDAEICDMPLPKFASAGLVLEVTSSVLQETVIFASDNAIVDPGENLVVYRASELKELVGLTSGDLLQVHAVKKTFRGQVTA